MRYKAFALIVAVGLLLPGCGLQQPPASSQPSAEATQQRDFTAKQVPVFREKLTDEKANLRFYDDMPNVAYINIAEFYKLQLPKGTMDAKIQDDGTWLLTAHTGADASKAMAHGMGGTAVVDLAAGTITSPDLPAFTNVMSLTQDGMDNVYFDGAEFTRIASVEYDKPADTAVIDLSKYGIVLRADDDGVWLPVQTLATIFTSLKYDFVTFNGQKLYISNDNTMRSLKDRDPEYGDPIFSQSERPDDIIQFDYGQLCLAFDEFYGKPASAPDVLKEQGLDAFLDSQGDDGKAVRDALVSKDPAEYLRGCDGLHNLLNVDGHTVIDIAKSAYLNTSKVHEDLYQRYRERSDNGDDLLNQLTAKKRANDEPNLVATHERRELSKKAYGKNVYAKQGNTAVIVLNSVDDVDYRKWHEFLQGRGPRPSSTEPINDPSLPNTGNVDSVAIFLDGIERAKADPEVKNVVIDVSNDDGGSDDVVLFISSIIANRQYERFQNPLTRQTITERYDVDRNLDGKFDDKDAQVDYSDLNFALLTSKYSFSCANMLACVLKDAGIPILGERSGGGSCSVQFQMTGDGPTYQNSSWLVRLINDAGEDMDAGAALDVDLIERAGSKKVLREFDDKTTGKHLQAEIYDYSSFYDVGVLNQVMNELYS